MDLDLSNEPQPSPASHLLSSSFDHFFLPVAVSALRYKRRKSIVHFPFLFLLFPHLHLVFTSPLFFPPLLSTPTHTPFRAHSHDTLRHSTSISSTSFLPTSNNTSYPTPSTLPALQLSPCFSVPPSLPLLPLPLSLPWSRPTPGPTVSTGASTTLTSQVKIQFASHQIPLPSQHPSLLFSSANSSLPTSTFLLSLVQIPGALRLFYFAFFTLSFAPSPLSFTTVGRPLAFHFFPALFYFSEGTIKVGSKIESSLWQSCRWTCRLPHRLDRCPFFCFSIPSLFCYPTLCILTESNSSYFKATGINSGTNQHKQHLTTNSRNQQQEQRQALKPTTIDNTKQKLNRRDRQELRLRVEW